MRSMNVAIVGAGIGGLAAAIDLARAGFAVTVFEKAAAAGGKIRQVPINGALIDSGPTVVTMKWVFEELFGACGHRLDSAITLRPLEVLARHAFDDGNRLDLFADFERSADAIGKFAGAREVRGFREFSKRARETYRTLETPFIRSDQPNPVSLAMGAGLRGLSGLLRISPFTTLWKALGEHFSDRRLQQLFARYATYCGSSPFECPATLMLVADVEQQGVWIADGGMQALASACQSLAESQGAVFRFNSSVAKIDINSAGACGITLDSGQAFAADIVIVNGDPAAVALGTFGPDTASAVTPVARASRSLSAVTFSANVKSEGFPLEHHNVFFCKNYPDEFDDIFRSQRLPRDPTVYVCAQDRGPGRPFQDGAAERLFLLVNAPAIGDTQPFSKEDIDQCKTTTMQRLSRCGMQITSLDEAVVTTPAEFERLFPATGGALYGQTSHGWTASFTRPAARTKIPRLYLAGGAVHPGPGVPMAALSGRIAARAVLSDLTSR